MAAEDLLDRTIVYARVGPGCYCRRPASRSRGLAVRPRDKLLWLLGLWRTALPPLLHVRRLLFSEPWWSREVNIPGKDMLLSTESTQMVVSMS